MTDQPRVLLFTGEGKGKTTAALGMAMRAVGHGMRVKVIQFIKADTKTGELATADMIENLEIIQTGCGFVPPADSPRFAEHREAAKVGFALAKREVHSGKYPLVVLDEICLAVSRHLIDEGDVLDLIDELPEGIRLVLTGRQAPTGLIEAADTVSNIECVKHAMDLGRSAEKGVEW